MKITIGEIINFILPFSNKIDVKEVRGSPFIKASIVDGSNFRQFFLYVIQTSEHEYAVVDSINDTNGNEFYVNISTEKPFIIERDIIRQQHGSGTPDDSWYANVKVGMDKRSFMDHMIDLLIHYDVIRYRKDSDNIVLSEFGINNDKIKRAVKKAFKDQDYPRGTVDNLLDIVYRKGNKFWMRGCSSKEMQVVSSKLKSIGLICVIEQDFITSIQFDRR